MFLNNKRGQSTLEYALLIAAVIAALIMMQIYLKRGVGGKLKANIDDIGEQYDPVAYTADHTVTFTSGRRDTVQVGVTRSELTQNEDSNKIGAESVAAWAASESLNTPH